MEIRGTLTDAVNGIIGTPLKFPAPRDGGGILRKVAICCRPTYDKGVCWAKDFAGKNAASTRFCEASPLVPAP